MPASDPTFTVRAAKFGSVWSIFFNEGYGPSEEIADFPSEKAAQAWIDDKSKGWLEKRRRTLGH